VNQHQASDEITEYRIEEAMCDGAAAIIDRLQREGYEEIGSLTPEAMELIRQAVRVSVGDEVKG
jgi:hypothetical protein